VAVKEASSALTRGHVSISRSAAAYNLLFSIPSHITYNPLE
jgi:hypothetical protein